MMIFFFRFSSSIHYLQIFREMQVSIVSVNVREKEEREGEKGGEGEGVACKINNNGCVPGFSIFST